MIHVKEQSNGFNLNKDTELLDKAYFNILDRFTWSSMVIRNKKICLYYCHCLSFIFYSIPSKRSLVFESSYTVNCKKNRVLCLPAVPAIQRTWYYYIYYQ